MTIKLTKFQKKKEEILRQQKEAIRALEEEERKERARLIDPVVEKIAKIASEQARQYLEKNPQVLEEYNFRKREATRAISEALESLFEEGRSATGSESRSQEEDEPERATTDAAMPAQERPSGPVQGMEGPQSDADAEPFDQSI